MVCGNEQQGDLVYYRESENDEYKIGRYNGINGRTVYIVKPEDYTIFWEINIESQFPINIENVEPIELNEDTFLKFLSAQHQSAERTEDRCVYKMPNDHWRYEIYYEANGHIYLNIHKHDKKYITADWQSDKSLHNSMFIISVNYVHELQHLCVDLDLDFVYYKIDDETTVML